MRVIVRNGDGRPFEDTFTDVVEEVERVPRQHAGWESVMYKGRRYQLFGGIRTAMFISLRNPRPEKDKPNA